MIDLVTKEHERRLQHIRNMIPLTQHRPELAPQQRHARSHPCRFQLAVHTLHFSHRRVVSCSPPQLLTQILALPTSLPGAFPSKLNTHKLAEYAANNDIYHHDWGEPIDPGQARRLSVSSEHQHTRLLWLSRALSGAVIMFTSYRQWPTLAMGRRRSATAYSTSALTREQRPGRRDTAPRSRHRAAAFLVRSQHFRSISPSLACRAITRPSRRLSRMRTRQKGLRAFWRMVRSCI